MNTTGARMRVIGVLVLSAAACLPAASARAAKWCFEDIGCPADRVISRAKLKKLSCENLAHVRNAIYDQNGYCFRDKALAATYDNTGCLYASAGAVPLNRKERRNIAHIVSIERAAGCK